MDASPLERAAWARSATLDDPSLLAECEVETFVASGPGGQHRNKTESGVRLKHRPSGIRVSATERRSQPMNRAAALERLRSRLIAASHVDPTRVATKIPRGARRRRLEDKRRRGETKKSRGGDW